MSQHADDAPLGSAWGSAIRYLSVSPARIEHGGAVLDASGWKVAKISDPLRGLFAGYAFGTYSVSDKATCAKRRRHASPSAGCDCGFYALKERHRAESLLERWRSTVLLKVELYGEIFEHRDGYRAEEQEVMSVAVPGRCGKLWCRGVTAGMVRRRRFWRAACAEHLTGEMTTLAAMRRALSLDVTVLDR